VLSIQGSHTKWRFRQMHARVLGTMSSMTIVGLITLPARSLFSP
jgi:hypothetical protein